MSEFSTPQTPASDLVVENIGANDEIIDKDIVAAPEKFEFVKPIRKIFDERDLQEFKKSPAKSEITSFVNLCAKHIIGRKISDICDVPGRITQFSEFMDRLHNLVDEVPPIPQPMRYGNKAFRQWHGRMVEESNIYLDALLDQSECAEFRNAKIELVPYLIGSFGVRW